MSDRVVLQTKKLGAVVIEPTSSKELRNTSNHIEWPDVPGSVMLDGYFGSSDLARILILMVEAEENVRRT